MTIGAYILVGIGLLVYAWCFTIGAWLIYRLACLIVEAVKEIMINWSDNYTVRKTGHGNKEDKDN